MHVDVTVTPLRPFQRFPGPSLMFALLLEERVGPRQTYTADTEGGFYGSAEERFTRDLNRLSVAVVCKASS